MARATESNTTSRRTFLAGAALAAMIPGTALASADPIFAAIDQHRAAMKSHEDACSAKWDLEERLEIGENTPELVLLLAAENEAFDRLEDVGADLLNTPPATLAGIAALCRYTEPLFNEGGTPNLPVDIAWDDGTSSAAISAFVGLIAAAVEGQLKIVVA